MFAIIQQAKDSVGNEYYVAAATGREINSIALYGIGKLVHTIAPNLRVVNVMDIENTNSFLKSNPIYHYTFSAVEERQQKKPSKRKKAA